MYLYVELVDCWGAYEDVQYGFVSSTTSRKRIVKIQLTEEQLKMIEPKKVGVSGGKDILETINVLCLQED